MSPQRPLASINSARAWLLSFLATAALAACGGGAEQASAPAAVESTAPAMAGFAGVQATPTFHMAAAQLDEPTDATVASATPQRFQIDAALAELPTARLTPGTLAQHIATLHQRSRVESASGTRPAATPIMAAVYTPAQIRAAYGLAALPAVGATLSGADAAAFGAGQTIYIVDAFDHPNAFADLARFNAKFGLPACTSVALNAATALPLPQAGSGCTFSVAYTDGRGALNSAAPAYSSGWIAEIALDVQWAHAIAPLARIVLIEAADANTNTLLGGVALANKMGAGVVSMSFGASEGSWVRSSDATFGAAGMTYVAAAGDDGAQALWPAVSPKVLAVGGTSLQWTGAGTRREVAWSSSGGGVSAYEALPAWQSDTLVPGAGAAKMRTVSDVAFNANPNTGQYVALTEKGATSTAWNAYGGTSIGAPQWAGLVAIANARRVLASRALIGDFHATLYKTIATSPGTYAADFADIVDGSDGACATCATATGFDTVTGWGTPNAAALLGTLVTDAVSTSTPTPTPAPPAVNHAPTLASGTLTVKAGAGFATTLPGKDADGDALSYTMTGGPAGMTLGSAGVLAWSKAVKGTYSLKVTVKDARGLSSAPATVTVVVKA